MVRQIILTGFVVFRPMGAGAQGRGMMGPFSHAVAVAPRVVVQAWHGGTTQAMPAGRIVTKGGAVRPKTGGPVVRSTQRVTTRRRFESEDINRRSDCSSEPGFGFDAVHESAVCGSNAVGSRRRGLQVPLFFPFFDGGFFLPCSTAPAPESSTTAPPQQNHPSPHHR